MFGLFSNFLKSPVLIVDEILLTELIESLLDWQEKKYSNLYFREIIHIHLTNKKLIHTNRRNH